MTRIAAGWVTLVGAGLLAGSMAMAQTSSSPQSYPQNSPSAPPQAGVSGNASAGGVTGSAGASATSQTGSQTATPTTAAPNQGAAQPSSAPQSTTTYSTTTQTTVPNSNQPATGTSQSQAAPGSAVSQETPAGQPASSIPGTVASTGQPEVLIDPGKIYNDKQPTSWVGKPVILQNVMIQDTNDSGNFWVGSDSDHRLLVVRQDSNPNLKAMRFHKGDVVTIQGSVQPASRYMAKETSEHAGDMHDAEKSSGVILLADNVTVASSTHK